GREHIQHHLLRGPSFHATGSRQHFRPYLCHDGQVSGALQRRVPSAGERDGGCAFAAGVLNSGEREWRPSTGGNTDYYVVFARAFPLYFTPAQFSRILIRLNRCGQRFRAARDNELNHLRIAVESGRTFCGIERRDSTAGPRSNINKPPAMAETIGNELDGTPDRWQRMLDGGGDLRILRIDQSRDLHRGFQVEFRGEFVDFLCREPFEL